MSLERGRQIKGSYSDALPAPADTPRVMKPEGCCLVTWGSSANTYDDSGRQHVDDAISVKCKTCFVLSHWILGHEEDFVKAATESAEEHFLRFCPRTSRPKI